MTTSQPSSTSGLRLVLRLIVTVALAWAVLLPWQGFVVASGAQTAPVGPGLPTVDPPPGELVIGSQIVITGKGWLPRQNVKLEICGNGATNGSVDCDAPSSKIFGVWDDGTLHAPMTVAGPPKPCPCLIRASTLTSASVAAAPVQIVGVGEAPIVNESPLVTGRTALKIVSAVVSSKTSPKSWFGGAVPQILTVTVENVSQFAVSAPLLVAAWGKDANQPHVISSPASGDDLAPGGRRTFVVPFLLDPFSYGTYVVKGSVGFVGDRIQFSTQTSTYPWALPILALVLFQCLVVLARNVLRRVVQRRVPDGAQEPAEAAGATAAGSADDSPGNDSATIGQVAERA